jgi:hypothetical protein
MRTKTLLFTAALTAAGVISSVAQVNSVNIVGYVNKAVSAGFTIIGNPLNTSGGNTLGSIFPSDLAAGTTLYRFTPTGFQVSTFSEQDDGSLSWGDNNNDVLNPGEGAFLFSAAARTITFVGDVPLGTALNNNLVVGFNLKSSIVPQEGQLDTVLGYPAAAGDAAYLLKEDGTGYNISIFEEQDDGSFAWNTPPVPKVGEGFWVLTATAKTWTRDFTMASTN